MNRQLYRIVFNRSRGQLMVVQETASSVSGGASGARDSARERAGQPARAGVIGGDHGGSVRFRELAWRLVCAFGLVAMQPLAWSQAQPNLPVVASSTAPSGQRPITDAARNGVPVVHIAPPSAAGVSRNQYQQFNVDANGLILNNSAGNVQTQLGGWINGNPQLGYVPARLIVNEVVGTGNSVLRGTIEVAGRRADVVIANPNGLLCDGCNFLNAGRATLSTGVPQYDAQGGLSGLDVRQGRLTVGAGGLNASNLEQLDLIARGLVLEGEVWAKNLQVLAGANQVLYATLQVTPQDGAGGAGGTPAFAVDIKDLGGMYANQIYLVATERGLGVNSTGRIAALQGNLELSSNGDLTLKDSYAAQGMLLASSGTTTLTGQTQTPLPARTPDDGKPPADIRINAANGLVQRGTIDAAGRVTITALTLDHSGTTIQRGDAQAMTLDIGGEARNTGTLYSAGDLQVSAGQVKDTHGRWLAQGLIGLSATGTQGISATGTSIATGGDLQVKATAGGLQSSQTSFNAGGSLVAAVQGDIANVQGLWQSAQDVTLSVTPSAARIANLDSTVLASGALNVSSAGPVDNTGGKLLGGESVAITTDRFINDSSVANQSLVASDHGTVITAAQGVSNRGGILSAKTVLAVDAQGRAVDNSGGLLVSDATLDLRGGEVTNRGGQIVSRGQGDSTLSIQAASLNNRGGLIDAATKMQIGLSGTLDNSGGRLQSGTGANASAGSGTMQADAGRFVNDGGRVVSRDALGLRTGELANDRGLIASTGADVALQSTATSNVSGLISAATDAGIKTQAMDNHAGQVAAGRTVAIDTQGGVLNNASGNVQAGDSVSIAAGGVGNTALAQIVSGRSVQITASGLDNTGGTVSAASTAVDLGAGSFVNQNGFIIGSERLTLRAGLTSNRGGIVSTNAALNIDTQGADFDNTKGTVQAGGELSIAAANLVNAQGRLSSAATTRVASTGVLDNTGGEISAARTGMDAARSSGDVSIDTHGQRLANDGGRVVAEGGLLLNAGAVSNTAGGSLTSHGDATLTVDRLDTSAGTVLAGSDLKMVSRADVLNDGGVVAANGRLELTAQGNASNRAGTVQAGGVLAVSAAGVDNAGGQLLAGAALNVSTGTLVNDRGDIAAQSVTASTGTLSNKAGSIGSRGALTLDAGTSALANDGGRIVAQGALKLTAGAVTNSSSGAGAGLIATNQNAVLKVAGLVNGEGSLQTAGDLQFDAPGAVSNTGGRILAGGDLRLNAAGVTNANGSAGQGVIASGRTLDIAASGTVSNSALMQGAGDVHVHAPTISNNTGHITAGQWITLDASKLSNSSGEIAADGAISAVASSVKNDRGRIASGAALNIQSAGAIDNSAGTLASNGGTYSRGSEQPMTAAMAPSEAIVGCAGLRQGAEAIRKG
ncbi:MAG: filamentous hemagglutinin N-terminal domain-containing protein [Burkholderiales bacterium]|nr:filamentous hemagglutinin N-terminal domain-containing protein [Burkholderiales bacterium]